MTAEVIPTMMVTRTELSFDPKACKMRPVVCGLRCQNLQSCLENRLPRQHGYVYRRQGSVYRYYEYSYAGHSICFSRRRGKGNFRTGEANANAARHVGGMSAVNEDVDV